MNRAGVDRVKETPDWLRLPTGQIDVQDLEDKCFGQFNTKSCHRLHPVAFKPTRPLTNQTRPDRDNPRRPVIIRSQPSEERARESRDRKDPHDDLSLLITCSGPSRVCLHQQQRSLSPHSLTLWYGENCGSESSQGLNGEHLVI
ncbi:hypothetical protein WMY93_033097 [Mugilogobius chulae]|uniref:Uncharacterized protein n=1 Tax=Mugilogobius chulae TaxID=88201 RepID=A0AAW0MPJ2_9GOBI